MKIRTTQLTFKMMHDSQELAEGVIIIEKIEQ